VMSAPENPSVRVERKSKLTFLATGVFLKTALNTATLAP